MERPSIAPSHLPVDGEPPRATDRGRSDAGRSDYRSEPSSARSSHRTSDASRTTRCRSTPLRHRSTTTAARAPLSVTGPLVTRPPSASAGVPECHHSRREARRGSAAARPAPRPAPAHLFAAHSPSHPCRHRRNRLRHEPARSEPASFAHAQTAPPSPPSPAPQENVETQRQVLSDLRAREVPLATEQCRPRSRPDTRSRPWARMPPKPTSGAPCT